MISFSIQLNDSLKRIDCKFFNPQEKILNINDSEFYIFKPFGDLAYVNGGKRLSKDAIVDKNGSIYSLPYIRGEDINNELIDFDNAVKISDEEYLKIMKYSLIKGDVCITNVGTIGAAGFVSEEQENSFSENIARLRVKSTELLLPEYLFYFCLSKYAKIQFDRFFVGSLQYKLSLDSIRNECKIILPITNGKIDLTKQKALVKDVNNIVNNQFVLKKKLRKAIFDNNNFVEKTLNILDCSKSKKTKYISKFSSDSTRLDALNNNPGYIALKNYLETIETISLKKCLKPNTTREKSHKDFYEVVDLANIDDDLGEIRNSKTVTKLDSDKIILNTNNIVISKLQTDKLKVALVDEYNNMKCGSSELLQFEVLPMFDKKFILYALRTQIVKQQWEYSLTGSSRMRINEDIILNTKIPYPKDENIRNYIVMNIDKNICKIKQLSTEIKDIVTIVSDIFKNFFNI